MAAEVSTAEAVLHMHGNAVQKQQLRYQCAEQDLCAAKAHGAPMRVQRITLVP